MTSVTGLEKILSQLAEKSIWPVIPKGLAEFESLALRELKLAAEMDCLAAERTLAAKQIRNGKIVTATTLRNIARKIHHISQDFAALWMARNKLSRLRDNIALFKRIENEGLKLSRR